MKILWVSNAAFTRTGYGTGTRQVTNQLAADGHGVGVLAYWGLQGGRLEVDGVQYFAPRNGDMWANASMLDTARIIGADFILIHRDIWVDDPEVARQFPVASWFPIDHAPVGEHLLERMRVTRWLATMSKWAVRQAADAGLKVEYIPHSVDTSVFKPASVSKGEIRAKLFPRESEDAYVPEDAFLMTIVAANKGFPSRKGFPEMFEAAARFMAREPSAYLYVHSLVEPTEGGPDLMKLASFMGIPKERFRVLNPSAYHWGLEDDELARFYQASDVLLNCSYGEGFGIPILEAQACGIPVITNDCTSMSEITFNGIAVRNRRQLTAHYAWWWVPEVDDIMDALRQLHDDRRTARSHAVAGMIQRDWSDEAVYNRYWRPFIERIGNDLALLRGGSIQFDESLRFPVNVSD